MVNCQFLIPILATILLSEQILAWNREFSQQTKENDIGSEDPEAPASKSKNSPLLGALRSKQKALSCYYGADYLTSSNDTGTFEAIQCDPDFDRCLVGKCTGHKFVEIRKLCSLENGCSAFGCADDEQAECQLCFGDLCNV